MIVCQGDLLPYVKIGRTVNLYNRLANIKTGCPHHITDVFVISSKYEEEVIGLEGMLHKLLPESHKGEWYAGTEDFFLILNVVLNKINGGFSYDEIEYMQDEVTGPEMEIMLHHHNFIYRKVSLPLKKNACVMKESIDVDCSELAVSYSK